MISFKPPKGHRVCLQYFKTKPDSTRQTIAIVTESYPIAGTFHLYLLDGKAWHKQSAKPIPDFDSEVLPLYETKR